MFNVKKYRFSALLAIALLFSSIQAKAETDNSLKAIQQRIKPIGQVNIETAPTTAAAAPATAATPVIAATKPAESQQPTMSQGEKIFNQTCKLCHGTGAAGAPKLGDKAAWKPHIDKGLPSLYQSALHGYKLMPPKGGCVDCTDEQIKSAVDYMVSKSK